MATCGLSAWSADVSYFYGSNVSSLYANTNSALSAYSSSTPTVSLASYGLSTSNSTLNAYSAVNTFAGTTYGSSMYGSSTGASNNTASSYQQVSLSIGGSSYSSTSSTLGLFGSSGYSGYSGGTGYSGYAPTSSIVGYGSGGSTGAPLQLDVVNFSIGPAVNPVTTPAPITSPGAQFLQTPSSTVIGVDVVPEPSSLLLMAGGLGLAAMLRKRLSAR